MFHKYKDGLIELKISVYLGFCFECYAIHSFMLVIWNIVGQMQFNI